ncbi:MAG: J domain-containing protein [Fretibacterium sp.]|nr:J domain-containing protein [Fretibacterium sp.]
MNLSAEIAYNLRVLGLAPGATPADVRSAFRRLARTCHPDVAGGQGAYRFQEITGAYTFLKGLTAEELRRFPSAGPERPSESDGSHWPDLFAWYRRRAERAEAEAEAAREAERREEERRARVRDERIDRVFARYEEALSERLARMEGAADRLQVRDIVSRLGSSVLAVRHLVLGSLGSLADRDEVLQAIGEVLCRWEVDDRTARLVAGLPLSAGSRRRLAEGLVRRADALPDCLISALLGLRMGKRPDPDLMDRYLGRVAPSGVALILRYWPEGVAPSNGALLHLIHQDDDRVLVPLLCAMKQRFPAAALRFRARLTVLLEHPAPTVRVWSRALLPRPDGVQ